MLPEMHLPEIPLSPRVPKKAPATDIPARGQTRDTLFTCVISLHLLFLPWSIGGTRIWAHFASLILASGGFLFAIWPREDGRASPGEKLLKFHMFWIGLIFLAYIIIQTLNPAWVYATDGKMWWMRRIPSIAYLPSGVEAPFERWGPWRVITIYVSAWLTACSLWIGITHREVIKKICIAIVINGFLIAVFGMVQSLAGNGLMFWFWKSPASSFYASFIYKNHAGSYFTLILAMASGLASWYYIQGIRHLRKSTPSPVFSFFAAILALSIFISLARGATLTMVVFFLIFLPVTYYRHLIGKSRVTLLIGGAATLLFCVLTALAWKSLGGSRAFTHLGALFSPESISVHERSVAAAASWEMLTDRHWLTGVGVSGFRFIFPIYQHRYHDIMYFPGSTTRAFWEHAHNDLLEFPIEIGLAGISIIGVEFALWCYRFYKDRATFSAISFALIVGILVMLLNAGIDFVFQCPAILVTWCSYWPIAALWAQFECRPQMR